MNLYKNHQRALLSGSNFTSDVHIDYSELTEAQQIELIMNGPLSDIQHTSESFNEIIVADTEADGSNRVRRQDIRVLEDVLLSGPHQASTIQSKDPSPTMPLENTVAEDQPENPETTVPVPPKPKPQRRGVEIDLNKYADDRQTGPGVPGNKGKKLPRRVRLTTPLSVMAQRALDEQVKTNNLLTEILSELRKKRN